MEYLDLMTITRIKVFEAINKEREKQIIKWGDQSHHSDEKWVTILTEEVGEAAKDVLDEDRLALIEEVTQVAAVAVQWLEILYERNSIKQEAITILQNSPKRS